jgi:hypothetical protein
MYRELWFEHIKGRDYLRDISTNGNKLQHVESCY